MSMALPLPAKPTRGTTHNYEIEGKLIALSFKRFDVVSDDSDHCFSKNGPDCIIKAASKAHKKIMKEWRILEKHLPDSIFVRVYENRMDLLRAVIVGAAGTPYHNGLYFFDFYFPPNYPTLPPHVYYHSRGLKLNPNLYSDGRVCLSLLNTWPGKKFEVWNPNESTVLQILVSIQALVLNDKPYFNEPSHGIFGRAIWENRSKAYNEDVFLLSCKTMLLLLRRPPKNFEVFVRNHFRDRADSILRACIAYMDGSVRVGYHGNNNENDGSSSSSSSVEVSEKFKASMEKLYSELLVAFQKSGASVGNFVERLKVEKKTTPSRFQVVVKKKNNKPGISKKVFSKLKKVLTFLGFGKGEADVRSNGMVGT